MGLLLSLCVPGCLVKSYCKGTFFIITFLWLSCDVLACEQALLGVGGGREKEERACNDVSGIFISALNFSTQNADWWILNLVLTSLLFACVVLTTQKCGGGVSICEGCENFSK